MEPNDLHFMDEAYAEALLALKENEVPVGAVVVKDSKIIGRGHNTRENEMNIAGHAEIKALQEAELKLGHWSLEGCTLYVTLEPCLMCSGAIIQSRLARLVYGADDKKEGAVTSNYGVFDAPRNGVRPLVSPGVKKKQCEELLTTFFAKVRAQ